MVISILTNITDAHKHQSLNNKCYIYIHDLWKQFKIRNGCNSMHKTSEEINLDENVSDDTFDHIFDNFEFSDFLYGVKITSIEYPVSCAFGKDQKVRQISMMQ